MNSFVSGTPLMRKCMESGDNAEVTTDEILKSMKKLGLEPAENQLEPVYDLAKEFIKSEKEMNEMASLIYEQCIKDRDFAKPAALLVNKLQGIDIEGTKFRASILMLLQKDFSEKEKLRASSDQKFMAFVAFLCQIFGLCRLANGEAIDVLKTPILQCLELMVTDGNEEEIECCLSQLATIGKMLEEKSPDQIVKFMEKTRRKLVLESLSSRVRCLLLELLEMSLNHWEPLPSATAYFYSDLLTEATANCS